MKKSGKYVSGFEVEVIFNGEEVDVNDVIRFMMSFDYVIYYGYDDIESIFMVGLN